MMRAQSKNALDESLRRLGGILASPSLILSYGHTTPWLERAWLRRLGLTRAETAAFLEELCRHSLLDEGARAAVEALCRREGLDPRTAAQKLLAGQGWPETDGEKGGSNQCL